MPSSEVIEEIRNYIYGNEKLRNDFEKFNAAIDKAKENFDLTEEEAIEMVSAIWTFPEREVE